MINIVFTYQLSGCYKDYHVCYIKYLMAKRLQTVINQSWCFVVMGENVFMCEIFRLKVYREFN
jgi:N-glycosylase/DNA lyase